MQLFLDSLRYKFRVPLVLAWPWVYFGPSHLKFYVAWRHQALVEFSHWRPCFLRVLGVERRVFTWRGTHEFWHRKSVLSLRKNIHSLRTNRCGGYNSTHYVNLVVARWTWECLLLLKIVVTVVFYSLAVSTQFLSNLSFGTEIPEFGGFIVSVRSGTFGENFLIHLFSTDSKRVP